VGFARPVRAEKAYQFAFFDEEADILDCPGHFPLAVEQSLDGASQPRFLFVSAERFGQPLNFNDRHCETLLSASARRERKMRRGIGAAGTPALASRVQRCSCFSR